MAHILMGGVLLFLKKGNQQGRTSGSTWMSVGSGHRNRGEEEEEYGALDVI